MPVSCCVARSTGTCLWTRYKAGEAQLFTTGLARRFDGCSHPIAGSTDTSLWTHYKAGERSYCGNDFPDGMRKNDRLAANVITPTTKAHDHDVPITPAEIVANGLMTQASRMAP